MVGIKITIRIQPIPRILKLKTRRTEDGLEESVVCSRIEETALWIWVCINPLGIILLAWKETILNSETKVALSSWKNQFWNIAVNRHLLLKLHSQGPIDNIKAYFLTRSKSKASIIQFYLFHSQPTRNKDKTATLAKFAIWLNINQNQNFDQLYFYINSKTLLWLLSLLSKTLFIMIGTTQTKMMPFDFKESKTSNVRAKSKGDRIH